MLFLGAWGKMIHEKISWHCPFKLKMHFRSNTSNNFHARDVILNGTATKRSISQRLCHLT
jgi:hypothetical protein